MKKELYKHDLHNIFTSDLKYIYAVEKLYFRALKRIIKAATDPDIVQVLEDILKESLKRNDRLEKIFKDSKIKPRGRKSPGIQGIIDESLEIIKKAEHLTYVMIDAALGSAIQRMLYYKISAYKTLQSYAKLLQNDNAANLFENSSKEDIRWAKKLNQLIVKRVKPVQVTLV